MTKKSAARVFAEIILAALVGMGSPALNTASAQSGRNGGTHPAFLALATDVPGYAYAVAVADLDKDGNGDVILAGGNNGGIGVFLSNGDGTFRSTGQFDSGGASPIAVVVADFNHDGKLDVAVANSCLSDCSQGNIGVLLGNGDGTFGSAQTYGVGEVSPRSLSTGDFNGDGNPDLAVAGYNQVTVLLGNRNGTFTLGQSVSAGGTYTASLQTADINGDGRPDLALVSSCNGIDTCVNGSAGVSVLLGNGDGTFQAPLRSTFFGWLAFSVAVGDFNGDGKPDLAVAVENNCRGLTHCTANVVSFLLGNGDGTFQAGKTYPSGGSLFTHQLGADPVNLLMVGDFNGDHKDDLALVNPSQTKSSSFSAELRVFLGRGNGVFKISERKLPIATFGHSIAMGDFNSDGNQDLIVVGGQAASVLIGNGLGLFQVQP